MMNDGLLFMDSGAHSLWNEHIKKRDFLSDFSWYDSHEFREYIDLYAEFVKEYNDVIDYYANVDVIYDPERSWKVLKYLEQEHGLHPVPVIHCNADLKWVERHLNEGYEFIGIGGLGQGVTRDNYLSWADSVFDMICPKPKRLPIVRTHGFAMTSFELMRRYPWFSVDSASWTKCGAFGSILIPHKRKGQFTFDVDPYVMAVSEDAPAKKTKGKHYHTLNPTEKKIVEEWLEFIDVPLGVDDKCHPTFKDGEQVFGVATRHSERKIANLLFFEMLRKSMPEYPCPYVPVPQQKASFFA